MLLLDEDTDQCRTLDYISRRNSSGSDLPLRAEQGQGYRLGDVMVVT